MPVYALVALALIGAVAGRIGDMLLKRCGLDPIGNIVVGVLVQFKRLPHEGQNTTRHATERYN